VLCFHFLRPKAVKQFRNVRYQTKTAAEEAAATIERENNLDSENPEPEVEELQIGKK
jgi:hypothetical protein